MSGEESTFENGEGDTAPRVQGKLLYLKNNIYIFIAEELERLNNAGTDINDLETSLTKARADYRVYLHVCIKQNFGRKNMKFRKFHTI